MPRLRKTFATKAEEKAHAEKLHKRRVKNSEARALRALSEGGDGEVDMDLAKEVTSVKRERMMKNAASSPKRVAAARENLTLAFDLMGGVPALVKWGKDNPTEFYRLWSRLIPKESMELSAQIPLEGLLEMLAGKGNEGHSVADAAFQLGNDLLEDARRQVELEDGVIIEG